MHLFFGCRRSGSEVKHWRPQVEAADKHVWIVLNASEFDGEVHVSCKWI